jgi:putative redox protein
MLGSDPAAPELMTTILCQYEGALRCTASHGPSGSGLSTDAPTDNQGLGERFSPTDLVATALATCILTIMGIVAERHTIPLQGCTARVEKTMTSGGVRQIERLAVWVALPAGLSDDQIRLLQRAAEGCPVKRSLEGSVAMDLHWETLRPAAG